MFPHLPRDDDLVVPAKATFDNVELWRLWLSQAFDMLLLQQWHSSLTVDDVPVMVAFCALTAELNYLAQTLSHDWCKLKGHK